MKAYEALSDEQIKKYQEMLVLPNRAFPHYEHLCIDGIVVYQYTDDKPLSNETFMENKYFKDTYKITLEVSNYGRVKINGEIRVADLEDKENNTFKHGLVLYINSDWNKKGIHRLVKETFDPIIDMDKYDVHHLNNNGNDNRLENLIWVTKEDHRKIDSDFNVKLKEIASAIKNK